METNSVKEVSKLYEVKVSSMQMQEDGRQKKVTEVYVVSAVTFGDAETQVIQYAMDYNFCEFEVVTIKPVKYSVYMSNSPWGSYYKARLTLVTIDEKTGYEMRTIFTLLVSADSFDGARNVIKEYMSATMHDYEIVTVTETNISGIIQNS